MPTPSRFPRPSLLPALLFTAFVGFLAWSLVASGLSISRIVEGLPRMGILVGEMVPPATDRLGAIGGQLLITAQMALVGTVLGLLGALPLALLAARNTTPHPWLAGVARAVVAFFRTVPDLVWAIFFVATVGLGPAAGTLALAVDTMGFCGRFFAESMEEVDPGPGEAIQCLGGSRMSVFACAILPAAVPGMIASSLFALEKSVRSSVILGVVGAGGIGVELAVSMEMFRYDQAATIILLILVLVLAVEHLGARLRATVLG
jgi:phosphonate transport system permease protein